MIGSIGSNDYYKYSASAGYGNANPFGVNKQSYGKEFPEEKNINVGINPFTSGGNTQGINGSQNTQPTDLVSRLDRIDASYQAPEQRDSSRGQNLYCWA